VFARPLVAAPTDLDPTFGTGGKVTTKDLSNDTRASAFGLQPDGKIVAAGVFTEPAGTPPNDSYGNKNFGIVRYNADGSIDATFGGTGKAELDFGGDETPTAVASQPDGKILFAGYTQPRIDRQTLGPSRWVLARILPNGTSDFAVITDFGDDARAGAGAIALQKDGKILVLGGGIAPGRQRRVRRRRALQR
jgi:uncharacterized delta-60 repeat protein